MMRQIKFRGKRKDTGEWVYGYLADETEFFLGEKYTRKVIFEDLKSFQTDNFIHVVENCEVEPESVGQFTGLYDVNNKEIYEGDVIRYIGNYDGDEFVTDVKYDVACFEPLYSSYIMTAFDMEGWLSEVKPRIIGNIHDTPELLK